MSGTRLHCLVPKISCLAPAQVHSSNKPRLWNMNKDVIIACALCGKTAELSSQKSYFALTVLQVKLKI